MTTTTTTAEQTHFRVRDDVELPPPGVRARVRAHAQRRDEYPIIVTSSVRATLEHLQELIGDAAVAVISDETVAKLHGQALCRQLRANGTTCRVHEFPPGEKSKSLTQATRLWDWLAGSDISRRDYIVTLGGGVINDIGGWVASAYMRGLRYINLPTSLLAQVDGAMGGKVAANHATAKNLIGAFYQPHAVISNVAYLATLDERHIKAGLAESIKKAVIASPAYWQFINENTAAILGMDLKALERLVACAAAIKTTLIERDPYEADLRRPLNFGHTIGHPLETITGYRPLLHGEAVAFGMVVETRIADNRGLTDDGLLDALVELLERADLPTRNDQLPAPVNAQEVIDAMGIVKRIRAGSLRYVLPVSLGETLIVDDVTEREVRHALHECGVK